MSTMFIGIDLGKTTSAGIVSIDEDGDPVYVDALQIDLEDGMPPKFKGDRKLAFKIDRLYRFLENVLDAYPKYVIGVERPPIMRGKVAVGQLQSLFGVALLLSRRSAERFDTFAVNEWRAKIDANVHFGSQTKKSVRSKMVKQRVVDVILEILDVEVDHDRADGLGVALATAITKGGLVL